MSPYIVNLTNHLIGKNNYDQLRLPSEDLRKHIALDLQARDVGRMSPETLGKIMASLDIGDVMASKENLFALVGFHGDCGDLLCEMVSACLAYTIESRLNLAEELGFQPFQRKARKSRGELVNGS